MRSAYRVAGKTTVCGKVNSPSHRYAMPDSPFCRCATSSPGAGEVVLWDGAFGMAVRFPAKVQSVWARQRLPLRGSWLCEAKTEGVRSKPSRENGIAERPQTLRYPEIKNIFSADHAQSTRGGHSKSSRPARNGVTLPHPSPGRGSLSAHSAPHTGRCRRRCR